MSGKLTHNFVECYNPKVFPKWVSLAFWIGNLFQKLGWTLQSIIKNTFPNLGEPCTLILKSVSILGWTLQFSISMLGQRSPSALDEFWSHILQIDGWKGHVSFQDGTLPKKSHVLSLCRLSWQLQYISKSFKWIHRHFKKFQLLLDPHSTHGCNSPGTIPFTFHVDGAEVYRDTEYYVWSCGSFLATGDVSKPV